MGLGSIINTRTLTQTQTLIHEHMAPGKECGVISKKNWLSFLFLVETQRNFFPRKIAENGTEKQMPKS